MKPGQLLVIVGIIVLVVAVALFVLSTQSPTTPPSTDTSGNLDGGPVVEAGPTATDIPLIDVVVAVQSLPRGARITEDAVRIERWPEQFAPFSGVGVIGKTEEVVGQIARTDIVRGQPVLSNMIVPDLTSLASVGSDAAAILPSGLVAVAVPVDRLTSVAYAIQDGDRVDIIVSMLFVDVDQQFQTISPNGITLFTQQEGGGILLSDRIDGRPDTVSLGNAIISPSEQQRPRLITQRTIQNALVVHVGDFPYDGRFIGVPPTPTPEPTIAAEGAPPPDPNQQAVAPTATTPVRPDIVTLGVRPQEAVVLTWAIEARLPITFALRAATDISTVQTTAVTMDYVMTTYNIQVPGKQPYALEPAIRSIRQLLAGNQISLVTSTGAAAGG